MLLGAPWAAVIEVSACSGLVTVIFISAISLSKIKKEEVQKLYADKKQMKFLPYVLIIAGIIIIVAAISGSISLPGTTVESAEDFREVFWNSRQADILGQIATILIGGIAVYVLMREDKD
jgi:NADH-quinone oxidoreductase subunit J